MSYTPFNKLRIFIPAIMLGFLLHCAAPSSSPDMDSMNLMNTAAKKSDPITECSEELLAANNLDVLNTDAEQCALWQDTGDQRCNQLADYAGLEDLELEFYLLSNGENTQCGCQCKDDTVFPEVSPCMEEVRNTLLNIEGGGYDAYIFTENHMLLQTVNEDYEIDPSRDRCKLKEGVLDVPLTAEVVELNGQFYLACSCTDTQCSLDADSQQATAYNYFGAGTSAEPYRIHTAEQLFNMSRNEGALDKVYELCQDIDLANFYGPSADTVYFSIGSKTKPFTGIFNGENHRIAHFTYDVTNTVGHYLNPSVNPVVAQDTGTVLRDSESSVGLFGEMNNAHVQDLSLEAIYIQGAAVVGKFGGLTGQLDNSHLENISVNGKIYLAYTILTISGAGGVAAYSYASSSLGLSSDIVIQGGWEVGGIFGSMFHGSLRQAKSTGSVNGFRNIGGLVGGFYGNTATISKSYASATVGGVDNVGGLVGAMSSGSRLTQSYASGLVHGKFSVGGLVGGANLVSIDRCYARATIIGDDFTGGLLGWTDVNVTVSNSFSASAYLFGDLNSALVISGVPQLSNVSNVHYSNPVWCFGAPCSAFNGEIAHANSSYFFSSSNAPLNLWNFANVWSIDEGNGLPYLDF